MLNLLNRMNVVQRTRLFTYFVVIISTDSVVITTSGLMNTFIGCYDDVGQWATFTKPKEMADLSPERCRWRCLEQNHSYFGLVKSRSCWCADTIDTETPRLVRFSDDHCNAPCPGDRRASCGGGSSSSSSSSSTGANPVDGLNPHLYSVYSVCPKGSYATNCSSECNCLHDRPCSIQGVCPDLKCSPGWQLNHSSPMRKPCSVDVDECSLNISGCQQKCINTEGSYFCECRTGFLLNADRLSCTNVSEYMRICSSDEFLRQTKNSSRMLASFVRSQRESSGAAVSVLSEPLIAAIAVAAAELVVIVILTTVICSSKSKRQRKLPEDEKNANAVYTTLEFHKESTTESDERMSKAVAPPTKRQSSLNSSAFRPT